VEDVHTLLARFHAEPHVAEPAVEPFELLVQKEKVGKHVKTSYETKVGANSEKRETLRKLRLCTRGGKMGGRMGGELAKKCKSGLPSKSSKTKTRRVCAM
jgi:hypothetical protein